MYEIADFWGVVIAPLSPLSNRAEPKWTKLECASLARSMPLQNTAENTQTITPPDYHYTGLPGTLAKTLPFPFPRFADSAAGHAGFTGPFYYIQPQFIDISVGINMPNLARFIILHDPACLGIVESNNLGLDNLSVYAYPGTPNHTASRKLFIVVGSIFEDRSRRQGFGPQHQRYPNMGTYYPTRQFYCSTLLPVLETN
ncbi:hypothetical protein AOL_s00081g63 [Orbilia oligospora ATCC 24927]|uniref:Uncharacterized protein n=1 Tax=Arthrobotrys oligospora (strain ATCC 24927 / CBS 115.81 / DSM 1491) TaxID=756982 RepID=G1XFC2_ARTOA|nr:hypothetical protein AOL_s00081g63 [Orbilia oligospora ATCC 24927]EGX48200.1 hypothetical protein AOL_s00081g63 [Orbilia oligospora ATCC 24927]